MCTIVFTNLKHQDIGWQFFMALNRAKEDRLPLFKSTRFIHFGGGNCEQDTLVYLLMYTTLYHSSLPPPPLQQRHTNETAAFRIHNQDSSDSEEVDELEEGESEG